MTDFEKLGLEPDSLEAIKSKVLVAYGRDSVNDLARSTDLATNGVNGRIDNKTWCKCEWCAPMGTIREGVYCLEIPDICKPRFLSTSCLYVYRSDPHFVSWYSDLKKHLGLIFLSTFERELPNIPETSSSLLWSFIFSISHFSSLETECIAKILFSYWFFIHKLCLKTRVALHILSHNARHKISLK